MLKKLAARILVVTIILTTVLISGGTQVFGAGTITNDTTNKVITVSNNKLAMQFNYNNKMVISSMKLGGTVETVEPTKPVKSEVQLNGVVLSASYTCSSDSLNALNDSVISYTDSPRNRWTSYGSGNASDWVVYDYGTRSVTVTSVLMNIYSDGGGVKAPASYDIQYWNGTTWVSCGSQVKSPAAPAGNAANTDTFSSVSSTKFKIVFTHQTGAYSGVTEMELYNGSNVLVPVWTGTGSLAASPTVNINGNVVTFSNISYGLGGSTINETWTVTANDGNVSLALSRTYNAAATLTDQHSLGFSFKEKAFDVVQRTEDGGSFILLDPNRNDNRFLSNQATTNYATGTYYNNDKYSFYTANVDLIDKLDSNMLSINVTSNRNRATKISRSKDRNGPRELDLEYKLNSGSFSFPSGTDLPLEIFQNEDFNAVSVTAGQTDTATYTIGCTNNLNKYYNIGTIPSASGLDAYKLAQYMQDFGRASVIDSNVGMGDCDLSGMGTYETWWYSVNALGLQGAGNEQYLQTLKNFVTFIKNNNYPIYNNGHLYARTYRQMTGWEGDNFIDGQAQFVAGISQVFNLSNDTTWLNSIKDMSRSILDYTLSTDTDGNGLIESSNDYTGNNVSSDWNDCINVSHESSYANAMFYKALVDWADIEEFVLEDAARAETYRNKATLLKTTFNKNVSDGGFWSPTSNQFVYWRDKDGSSHGDVGYVFCNAYPVIFGMVDASRAQTIMNKYNDFMLSNNLTLMPTQRSSFAANEQHAYQDWENFENGGIFLQQTYDMMGAFAAVGNKDRVLSMLKTATNLYNNNNLWSTGYLNWDFSTGTEIWTEPWMTSGVRAAAGYYNFILGIQPKYNSIIIDPCADSSLNGVSANYTLRGHNFTIALTNDSVRNITTDGAIPVQSVWSRLPLSVKYQIKDENLTNSTLTYSYADSGLIGKVGYTFSDGGQHRLTLSEDMNCSNLALNTSQTGYPSPSASYTFNLDNVWGAVDGLAGGDSTATRSRWTSYSSGNTTDWYAVDFGANKDVGQICMNIYSDCGGVKTPASYDIQYWNGSTWVSCASQFKYPANPAAGENLNTFTPVNTQKVRVVFTHQTGSYSGLNEFRAYSSSTVNYLLNSAKGGTPTPSASYSSAGDSVWGAIDGDWTDGNIPRTRWACWGSGSGSDWYSVNLGSSKSISDVRVNFFNDGLGVAQPSSCDVQYWNGSAWVDCANQTRVPAVPIRGENDITFTSVNTSQIRIVLTHQSGKYSGITEIRAYK